MENEVWLPVVGYAGYEISSLGRARSLDRKIDRIFISPNGDRRVVPTFYPGKILTPRRIGKRYVGYCFRWKSPNKKAHIAVLEAFRGPRPKGLDGCHNNGKHEDNRLSNVRWDTRSSNGQDTYIHGGKMLGERNPTSKQTDDQVRIFKSLRPGLSVSQAAKKAGIAYAIGWHIDKGNTWRHI